MPDFQAIPRDAPTMVAGSRDYNSILSNRIKVDMDDTIHLINPSATPFLTLTGKLRKTHTATQPRVDWMTKDEYPRIVTASAAYLVGDTSVVLSAGHGDRIAANALLKNLRTDEIVLVTAVATDTLTVVRAIGSTAAAIDLGDSFYLIGNSYTDGADIGTLKSVKETDEYNLCQIVRRPYGWTDRTLTLGLYGGRDPVTEREWQAVEHKKDIEALMFFGRRHSRTESDGKLRAFMGGLDHYIASNVWDMNGNMPTESAFVDFLEEAMRYGDGGFESGSRTKWLLHSSRWATRFNAWFADRLRYDSGEKTGGMAFNAYTSPHGMVNMVTCATLDRAHQDRAYLIDPSHLRFVTYEGRATKLLKDRQGNGLDATYEEWLTDCSMMVHLEMAHARIQGLPV